MSASMLPQDEAVREAIAAAWEAELEFWENNKHGEEKRTPMFTFAQCLRGCPVFRNMDGYGALMLVRASLKGEGRCLADLETNCEDHGANFLKMWDMVVLPATFDHAVHLGRQHPVEEDKPISAGFSAFVSLCAHLQELSGDAPIFIGCEAWGDTLGVSGRTICTYRDIGVKMGLLKLISEGNYATGKAARFRYVGHFKYR